MFEENIEDFFASFESPFAHLDEEDDESEVSSELLAEELALMTLWVHKVKTEKRFTINHLQKYLF